MEIFDQGLSMTLVVEGKKYYSRTHWRGDLSILGSTPLQNGVGAMAGRMVLHADGSVTRPNGLKVGFVTIPPDPHGRIS